MKKTYWWRWGFLATNILIVAVVLIYDNYLCFVQDSDSCPFHHIRWSIIQPLFLYSIFLLAVSPFLFLVRDKAFLAWLRFAGIWTVLTAVFVSLAPVSQGGWLGIGPEKWSVTMVMGWGFLIVSLILLVWQSRKRA